MKREGQERSYPGMPMAPRAKDKGMSFGQSGIMGVRSVPSESTNDLQPQFATT